MKNYTTLFGRKKCNILHFAPELEISRQLKMIHGENYISVDIKKIETEEDRIRFYGQKDHMRLYGNDIKERIEKFRFDVKMISCNKINTNKEIEEMGFLQDDSVFLCERNKEC